ncbi:helix-turn-helix domain-containing protein [Cytophagales bacterium LB-30]|uniref:Helix-turn-helix domain-containing protein n=1 Tax=Shiella aurantiaca TaxID=3058365 RepID=A0ABT8F280_9BACT|nr:helix-turn-helix domain-containing protein [Shiella aurantiaca]MDN4164545.1 helix-turn-helix domain-containing protein [Shiella aurantiaca]
MASNVITLLIVYFAFDGRLVREEEPTFQLEEKQKGSATLNPSKGVIEKAKREALKQEIDDFFAHNPAIYASDFSLQKMAELVDAPLHHLSFVINAEHGQSFSDLLGQYRIIKAKAMIESDSFEHLSIEGIGKSVGYKSKSTFFSHFKKNTGMTPLDFKRSRTQNR